MPPDSCEEGLYFDLILVKRSSSFFVFKLIYNPALANDLIK